MRRIEMSGGLMALLLGACAPQAGGAAAPAAAVASVHPISGLEVVPLTVTTGERVHRFRVEVASSPAEQAHGLMFRERMGKDEGMLFPMDPPRPASFWMKNTVIPLDIIFIGSDGRVTNIAAQTVPHSLTPLASDGPVKAVLELVGGRAAELGIGPGAQVAWQRPG